jgi:hypothetical protein
VGATAAAVPHGLAALLLVPPPPGALCLRSPLVAWEQLQQVGLVGLAARLQVVGLYRMVWPQALRQHKTTAARRLASSQQQQEEEEEVGSGSAVQGPLSWTPLGHSMDLSGRQQQGLRATM